MPTRSSGVPMRDSGMSLTMSATISCGVVVLLASVSIGPGRDRVDPDVHTAEFPRKLLGQAVDADLGQAVEVRVHPRRGRRLVDDRAAAALGHLPVHRAGAHQRAVEVHAHELLVVVPVHGQQQIELHAAEDRGVVHQIVDAAELGQRAVGHGLGRLRVGHVDRHADRRPPIGDDLLGHPLAALGVDIGDHHRGALAGQRLGVGLADTATGPGDNGDLVVELTASVVSLIHGRGNDFGFGVLLEPELGPSPGRYRTACIRRTARRRHTRRRR